jgi:uncharacterized membrane protein YhhN
MPLVFSFLLAITIFSKYKFQRWYRYFKPFLTIFIIAQPLLYSDSLNELYIKFIMAALILSLVGDLFLLNHEKYFKHGLISFLFAHVFYSISILLRTNNFNLMLILIYVGILFLMLLIFRDKLSIAVVSYLIVIITMGFLACNYFYYDKSQMAEITFIASLLFIVSDFTLAYNKFKNKFHLAEVIILSTYFIAQYLFAVSAY